MRVILECDGDREMFQDIFCAMDDEFNINDNIFYTMDYEPNEKGVHCTKYGTITIKIEE